MEYLNNNWFNHDYTYYNYSEIFNTPSLKDIRTHFYSTNNIAEALHNKLALYIPTKKVSNTNFIMSICNVIKNYEIKCNDIIRKDYITQTLIDLAKKIKYNNYKCTYDEFLELEKNVIKLTNNDIEINVLKN